VHAKLLLPFRIRMSEDRSTQWPTEVTGIVDDDIDMPERGDRCGDQVATGRFIRHIRDNREASASDRLDLPHRLLRRLEAHVGDDDVRSLARQAGSNARPDATSATGDDGDIFIQFHVWAQWFRRGADNRLVVEEILVSGTHMPGQLGVRALLAGCIARAEIRVFGLQALKIVSGHLDAVDEIIFLALVKGHDIPGRIETFPLKAELSSCPVEPFADLVVILFARAQQSSRKSSRCDCNDDHDHRRYGRIFNREKEQARAPSETARENSKLR